MGSLAMMAASAGQLGDVVLNIPSVCLKQRFSRELLSVMKNVILIASMEPSTGIIIYFLGWRRRKRLRTRQG